MIHYAGILAIFLLFIVGMIGCDRSSGGMGETRWKASEIFADPKVVEMAEALQRTDLTTAEELLRDGVDINALSRDGNLNLPLWTMLVKNKGSFKWAFEHGANPNLLPKQGRGVLHLAAAADDPEWLEILLQYKTDMNLKSPFADVSGNIIFTETPLFEAVFNRRKKNVEMLIKAGADVNLNDQGSGTPVITAASIGWNEGVYILLEAGADFRPRTTGGITVTDAVVGRRPSAMNDGPVWRDKVIELLRERGADIEAAREKAHEKELKDRKEHPWRYEKE